jgi:hypothetical protein
VHALIVFFFFLIFLFRFLFLFANLQMCRMRLPATMTWVEKREVVNNVIDMLGLSHIQNSRIGDEVTRGISGGVCPFLDLCDLRFVTNAA